MPVPKHVSRKATAEDYWSLPEGRRAELIDGTLYDMAPPSRTHQDIVAGFTHALRQHVLEHGGPCRVYPAPFAVNLDADDATWVEPDVSLVCDPAKLSERGCEGAPDFVVEVVSPTSRRIDYLTKATQYEQAGVREYWIVDPTIKRTTVYRYETAGPAPLLAPFDIPVEVGVLEGLTITVSKLL